MRVSYEWREMLRKCSLILWGVLISSSKFYCALVSTKHKQWSVMIKSELGKHAESSLLKLKKYCMRTKFFIWTLVVQRKIIIILKNNCYFIYFVLALNIFRVAIVCKKALPKMYTFILYYYSRLLNSLKSN